MVLMENAVEKAARKPIPVAFALGSNVGDRMEALRKAVLALRGYVDISAISPVYETAPAYVTDQPVFLNAAVIGTTLLEPLPLLWKVKDIETKVGRKPTFRYGPRVIDIDILFYGDLVYASDELTIPHTSLPEREFVLRPLCDIAPDLKHPKNGKTVADMLTSLADTGMTCLGKVLA